MSTSRPTPKSTVSKIAELEVKILAQNEEVVSLRAKVFALRNELHTLKNSRVLGKIIVLREFLGSSAHRITRLASGIPHQIRVVVAPLVPGPVRKKIKQAVRHARLRAKSTVKPVHSIMVHNEKWGGVEPLVSVVIPYYNAGNTIDETLESLAKQIFQNFEVIVVNDGSTDSASVAKLQQLRETKKALTYIDQNNQGVAAARNSGISRARGKYIICLDSDDLLTPTFIEKATMVLEAEPDIALVTTHQDMFGVIQEVHKNSAYDPLKLYRDNMVITAAEFRKDAWVAVGGYKSGIGYEDWEFWLSLGEHGYWGKRIPEELFLYRTSLQSRYIDDKDVHWDNLKNIRTLHPDYKRIIKRLQSLRQATVHSVSPDTAFVNMNTSVDFREPSNKLPKVLIAMPWMTFGGAETLVLNFCRELKDDYNLSFVTGLRSDHEWEYKFKELTPNVYHLPELFDDSRLYLEFISNYIATRKVDIVHMVHTNFVFPLLDTLRQRHPHVKFLLTMFNDRVPEYFGPSVELHSMIDAYTTDNLATATHYREELPAGKSVTVIPNGIDCNDIFSPTLFDAKTERDALGVKEGELAVFFIGRLSEEKNPDVYVEVAEQILSKKTDAALKFFVVGDGKMRPEITKKIDSFNDPRITYLGYRAEVANLLSAADMFVLPSSIEGFPLSILEAMAMNVAVIASDVGAVADVIESGRDGFVIRPGSVEDIVKAIEKLAADPKLLQAIKQAAHKKLKTNYSSSVLKRNYVALYKGALK